MILTNSSDRSNAAPKCSAISNLLSFNIATCKYPRSRRMLLTITRTFSSLPNNSLAIVPLWLLERASPIFLLFCKSYKIVCDTTSIKSMSLAILTAIVATLSGCAMQATLQVNTNPAGGYVTEFDTGLVAGVSPVVMYYDPAALVYRNADGCFLVKGFSVQWVSGATAAVNPVTLCGSTYDDYFLTVNRPATAPGLEKDLQFALQLQTLAAQQQQAEAARQAAALQMFNSINSPAVKCTSTPIGNQVHTKCK